MLCERELPVERELSLSVRMEGEKLVGTAVVFGKQSSRITEGGRTFHEVIMPGAFTLAHNITLTFRHDDNAVYADTQSGTLRLREDSDGIHFEADLPAYASRLREQVQQGVIRGMSFGFVPQSVEVREGVQYVKKGHLAHIAAVYSPAYPQTSVKVRERNNLLQKIKVRGYISS